MSIEYEERIDWHRSNYIASFADLLARLVKIIAMVARAQKVFRQARQVPGGGQKGPKAVSPILVLSVFLCSANSDAAL